VALSATRLADYLNCGRYYYYRYLCPQVPKPPSNMYLARGVAAHSALEHNYRYKVQSGKNLKLSNFLEVYESELSFFKDEVDWGESSFEENLDLGVKVLKVYYEDIAPFVTPYPSTWSVEHGFEVEIPVGDQSVAFVGLVDLISSDFVVIDHKTKTKKPTDLSREKMQLVSYAYSLITEVKSKKIGPLPEEILNRLRRKRKFDVRVDCLIFSHYPTVTTHTLSFTSEDFQRFKTLVAEVWKGVEANVFVPNYNAYWGKCEKFCPFYEYCIREEYLPERK